MIRRPPRSTLFPYNDALPICRGHAFGVLAHAAHGLHQAGLHALQRAQRSEEHTSELQSRLHLVCRLLLEKKEMQAAPPGAAGADTRKCPTTRLRPTGTALTRP